MKFVRPHLLALTGIALAATNAAASTVYVVPGTICEKGTQYNTTISGWDGSIQAWDPNNETHVACPLVRHNGASALSGGINVRLYHWSSASISCDLVAADGAGTEDWETNSTSTSGAVSMSIPTTGLTNYTNGAYSVWCILEHQDQVLSIKYTEP